MAEKNKKGYIILENGKIFEGIFFGYKKEIVFEIVFNTSTSGYVQILSDPSYAGQGIVFAYPLIGNYGVNIEKLESNKFWVSAAIVNTLCETPMYGDDTLEKALLRYKIPGLKNVDTRAIVRTISENGCMKAKISFSNKNIIQQIKELKKTNVVVPIEKITTNKINSIGKGKYKIALYDYGVKTNIVRNLLKRNCQVDILPNSVSYRYIINNKYDGILLSNGPGDPFDNKIAINNVNKLLQTNIPIFGICMGHQILGLASGGKTNKINYGHRGPNQPVRYLCDGKVYMTSQNHGFEVIESSLKKNKNIMISFKNANDQSVEGLKYLNKPVFSVQFHPEASPGPQDTLFLFDDFINNVKKYHGKK
ncbi:MAG: carbamoyl phosphate synthase small subunit [Mycoplasmataceae bacterium]|jgi:carbamoyl-phosphate synthase small subunit|nr:carbamoyl phosphate synthase small subunit [Mycoplasmataceae bacterium]